MTSPIGQGFGEVCVEFLLSHKPQNLVCIVMGVVSHQDDWWADVASPSRTLTTTHSLRQLDARWLCMTSHMPQAALSSLLFRTTEDLCRRTLYFRLGHAPCFPSWWLIVLTKFGCTDNCKLGRSCSKNKLPCKQPSKYSTGDCENLNSSVTYFGI